MYRAHVGDRLEQLAHTTVTQRLALQRDHHGVGGGQPVDREDAERRRTVDEHEVEAALHRCERACERVLPTHLGREHHLGAGEVDGRREQRAPSRRSDDVGRVGAPEQHVVERRLDRLGIEPGRIREAGLRIEIHEQDAGAVGRERLAEAVRRRRLADAALLVRDRDDRHGGPSVRAVPRHRRAGPVPTDRKTIDPRTVRRRYAPGRRRTDRAGSATRRNGPSTLP